MERHITENEERCYRLRHHNFAGLTTRETAKRMKISPDTVRTLLKSLRAKAPQLFPILTQRQYLIYGLYVIEGLSQDKIANYLHTTQSNICDILKRVKKKGMPFLTSFGLGNVATYEEGMDGHIIHKF